MLSLRWIWYLKNEVENILWINKKALSELLILSFEKKEVENIAWINEKAKREPLIL